MNDLRQAAQQALELLKQLQGGCTDSDDGTVEAITVWCPEVIANLEAALEQDDKDRVWIEERKANWALQRKMAQENQERDRLQRFADSVDELGMDYERAGCDIAEDGVCEALECCNARTSEALCPEQVRTQPEQEPVAWRIRRIDPVSDWTLIYQRSTTGENFFNMEIQPLYTHPSSQRSENLKSREWRGLTEEEIDALIWHPNGKTLNTNVEYARAIEAKLKERNNG